MYVVRGQSQERKGQDDSYCKIELVDELVLNSKIDHVKPMLCTVPSTERQETVGCEI